MAKQWDAIWINATLVTCDGNYQLIKQAAIAVKRAKIAWIGSMASLPDTPYELADEVHDANGACLTPGLIDCHTHLIYAGNRAHEFEMRLQGATYEQIAEAGGGIHSTVARTRSASPEDLLEQSLPRARSLLKSGVTTIEIKSGYGLDLETELKMLRVAKEIEQRLPLRIVKTFLGAHTVPKEYRDHPEKYVDIVCEEMIPQVAKEQLANAVDVFCEKIAFTAAQTERIFKTAQQNGLRVKCHAEQLSHLGASILAAQYQALSVDHLEHLTEDGVKAIAKSGTVAVLLPGAYYFLREKHLPPLELLRQHQIPIAIASDCNPGTSPIIALPIILNMACTLFRLTPEEAWLGVTQNAAKALALSETKGALTVGKDADFALWSIEHPTELTYYLGGNLLKQLVIAGKILDLA